MADLASLRIHLQFCVLILFNNFDIIHHTVILEYFNVKE